MLPLPLLLSLNRESVARWLRVGGYGLAIALVGYCYLQHIELGKQRAEVDKLTLAYEHPRTAYKVQTRRVEGPVKVVTKIVEVAGRRETTTEETRGAIVTDSAAHESSEPVLVLTPRSSRWLVALGVNPIRPETSAGQTVYAGYGLRNRVDLLVGCDRRGSPRLLLILRF